MTSNISISRVNHPLCVLVGKGNSSIEDTFSPKTLKFSLRPHTYRLEALLTLVSSLENID